MISQHVIIDLPARNIFVSKMNEKGFIDLQSELLKADSLQGNILG